MRASLSTQGREWRIDLDRPIDLSVPIGFDGPALRHFGAPAPRSMPFETGGFSGSVATGAGCNCRTIMLTPHCNGTHTECVAHLTLEPLDVWRIVPAAPVPALAMSVAPVPVGEDLVVTRAALASAWLAGAAALPPIALILRTAPRTPPAGTPVQRTASRDGRGAHALPPWMAADAIAFIVEQGITHLVIDQPSLDRTHDAGRLAAHRVFFGLPPGSRRLADAARPRATVTEYASVPDTLPDGPCALAWQVPAIAGDAVPSRPLAYRYES